MNPSCVSVVSWGRGQIPWTRHPSEDARSEADEDEPAAVAEGVVRSLEGKRLSKSTVDCCHRMIVNGDALAVVVVAVVVISSHLVAHEEEACDSCRYPCGKVLGSDRLWSGFANIV